MPKPQTNPATAALVLASLLTAAIQLPPAPEVSTRSQQTVSTQTERSDNTGQSQRAPNAQQQQQFADDPKTLLHTRRNIMRRLRRHMERKGLISGPRQWRKLLAQARRNLKDPAVLAIMQAD